MNTKKIIESYGDNQEAIINQLQNDLRELIKQRKAYEANKIDSVFKEINNRYLAVVRKLKVDWDENLLIESYPICLKYILSFSKYSQEMFRALHHNNTLPSIYNYIPSEINMTNQVGEFLKLQLD